MAGKWILSADVPNSVTGERGDSALIHDKADLDRRLAAARKAGVKVKVRKAQ
ncbi:hypothetical protein ACFQY7_00095 [Actinomadura luteofluorescens]|uniref:Uncharacterized protein n=1 Tax=Actinomadura luteofluorescens TaxID=46163 RepID=A0A7Y9JEI9_9ACTN|nr:hypothetical protein [Actinomadura luteofluorescens]NYD45578.1 hypothetical protein [Actinomadura luteofluorescens]